MRGNTAEVLYLDREPDTRFSLERLFPDILNGEIEETVEVHPDQNIAFVHYRDFAQKDPRRQLFVASVNKNSRGEWRVLLEDYTSGSRVSYTHNYAGSILDTNNRIPSQLRDHLIHVSQIGLKKYI